MGLEFSRSSWDGVVDEEIVSIADNLKWRNRISKHRQTRKGDRSSRGVDLMVGLSLLPPVVCSF